MFTGEQYKLLYVLVKYRNLTFTKLFTDLLSVNIKDEIRLEYILYYLDRIFPRYYDQNETILHNILDFIEEYITKNNSVLVKYTEFTNKKLNNFFILSKPRIFNMIITRNPSKLLSLIRRYRLEEKLQLSYLYQHKNISKDIINYIIKPYIH